ncbi:lysylphosphatidylglycerol synthase transmembrane domain-containing protein [Danxiaibacter flavus]|uniref:Lysylphosphatidylglycerol synthase transmembrane domain-containing protein n=2 Tax=Danxiaibacter flavus TaxID=3049108 RepID=A0ABV3ZJD1_9BACT
MPLRQHTKSALKLLLKIGVTAACLWYVSRKIDWSKSWETIQRSDSLWLMVAVIFFTASKVVSSLRLNIYFKNIGLYLSQTLNLKLSWLGMYYNLFLPGGIGGDAYKVILLNRHYNQSAKLLTAAVLLDRISGLVGLGILAVIYYWFVFNGEQYPWLLVAAILPGIIVYYFVVKKFFPSFISSFWSTFWIGLLVQGLQVVCVYCLMTALHLHEHHTPYILIFLLSSIIAVLPFTIGGLGAREVVFLWGSNQFLLNRDEAVCISLLFYLITVLVSLAGIIWVYKKPLNKIPVTVGQD